MKLSSFHEFFMNLCFIDYKPMFYKLSVDQSTYCFSNSRAIKDAVKNCKPRVPNTELYKGDMLLSGKQQQSVHCYVLCYTCLDCAMLYFTS